MPMVLPPSVIGYYMLVLYSPRNAFGGWLASVFNVRLAFSFEGVLIASVIFSLPFMIQPLHNGLRALPDSLREASYTLGKSKINTFFSVLLPNIKPSVITAVALTFAHSIGEFGVVLMVGGNMPGETRVASIAIYDEVQALNFKAANQYALILFLVSLALLTTIYSINKKYDSWKMM
jgi:molybdate transport system permease protein